MAAAQADAPDANTDLFAVGLVTRAVPAMDATVAAAGKTALHGKLVSPPSKTAWDVSSRESVVDQQLVVDNNVNGTHVTGSGSTTSYAENWVLHIDTEGSGTSVGPSGTQLPSTLSFKTSSDLCPDETGTVRGSLSLSWKYSVVTPTSQETANVATTGTAALTGHVDDGAHLTKYDLTGIDVRQNLQNLRDHTTGGFTWQGYETGIPSGGDPLKNGTPGGSLTSHLSDAVLAKLVGGLDVLMHVLASRALEAAEKAWQNGYCLDVVLDGLAGKKLKSGDTVAVQADVQHKKENRRVKLPLTTLPIGGTVTPEKGTSPLKLTFKAADKPGGGYQLIVETTSKRGHAINSISWSTGGSFSLQIVYTQGCQGVSATMTATGRLDPDKSDPSGTLVGKGTYSGNRVILTPGGGSFATEAATGSVDLTGGVTDGQLVILGLTDHLESLGGQVPASGGTTSGNEHGDFTGIPVYDPSGNRVYCDRTWTTTATPLS